MEVVLAPPAPLLRCDPEPPLPAEEFLTDLTFNIWASQAVDAGAVCRSQLEKVREWVTRNAPTPPEPVPRI